MLTIVPITENFKDLHRVIDLYMKSFPANERDSIRHLLKEEKLLRGDFVAFYDIDTFCGFAYLLTHKNITHILYLAIDTNLRDHGYGHKALDAIKEWKKDHIIIVDVEADDPSASNKEIREKRINFYLKNQFTFTDINYYWKDTHYDILASGGTITRHNFDEFWQHFAKDEDMGHFLYITFKKKSTIR